MSLGLSAGEKLEGTPEPRHIWSGKGGVRIAGDSWGDPRGPLVILQHGLGQTRHAWKSAGERLGAAGYWAVALDARGHGDSDWSPDRCYSPDTMIEDLRLILTELRRDCPVLVGASLGGITSLIAIGERRILGRALVLVDVAAEIEVAGVQRINDFMKMKPEGFDSIEEAADVVANYRPNRVRPKTFDGLAKNLRRDASGKYRWHWDPAFHAAYVEPTVLRSRLESCARNLHIPALLVRGGMSDVLSEAGASAFMKLCPAAEYVNVKNASHMVAADRNDIFADAIINFLSRTPALPSVVDP